MGVKVRERPKGSGIWWIFINHQGKRKAKRVGNKTVALEVAKKIQARLVLGEVGIMDEKSQLPMFKEYANLWLETYIKPLRRRSTYNRYRFGLEKYVFSEIGDMRLDEIKKKDIRNLLLKVYGKGLSKSTVCLTRDIISGPMAYAVDEELIPANLTTGIVKRLDLSRDKRCAV